MTEVLHFSKEQASTGETRGETKPKRNAPTPRRRNTSTEIMLNYSMWITLSQTQKPSHFGRFAVVFEDNEAVIKMIVQVRGPTMRHVSRTHRVALDWLFDRIKLDLKIQVEYVDTKKQTRRHVDHREFHS